jgi:hypothetical protein
MEKGRVLGGESGGQAVAADYLAGLYLDNAPPVSQVEIPPPLRLSLRRRAWTSGRDPGEGQRPLGS